MNYLYLKTHNKTGLIYLGKTKQDDPWSYTGSGKLWKRHIKKHGYDVKTQILLATDDENELNETGVFFSRLFGVVKSSLFANLMEESGDGGDTWSNNPNKEETITKIVEKTRGQKRTENQRQNISIALNRIDTSYSGSDIKNNATFSGKKHSAETIEKIKASNKRGYSKNSEKKPSSGKSYNKGIPKTEEHKRKLKESLLGRKPTNSREIVIEEMEFVGMVDAANHLGIPYSTIRNRIKSRNIHYANIYDKNMKKVIVDGVVFFENELTS